MAKKKLETKQQKELERLVMEGKTPEDISKYFGIAVSSVHNYKRMLREKGVKVPDVRGKRPSNITPVPVETLSGTVKPSHNGLQIPESYMRIEINSVVFYISPKAKSVSLDKNSLTVDF